MIPALLLSASIALAAIERQEMHTNTQTIVFEVKDLLMDIPDFAPPDFPITDFGFHNTAPPAPRRLPPTDRTTKSRILGLMWMEYPEARSITIWDGLVIIKLPKYEEPPISLKQTRK